MFGTVGVEDDDAALLVRHPRRADTDDDLLLPVLEQVADGRRAVDRGRRARNDCELRPVRDRLTVGRVDDVQQTVLVTDDDVVRAVTVDVGDRRRRAAVPAARLVASTTPCSTRCSHRRSPGGRRSPRSRRSHRPRERQRWRSAGRTKCDCAARRRIPLFLDREVSAGRLGRLKLGPEPSILDRQCVERGEAPSRVDR